jgi:hypothetical protein
MYFRPEFNERILQRSFFPVVKQFPRIMRLKYPVIEHIVYEVY